MKELGFALRGLSSSRSRPWCTDPSWGDEMVAGDEFSRVLEQKVGKHARK